MKHLALWLAAGAIAVAVSAAPILLDGAPSELEAAADTAADAQEAPQQAAADLAELRAELARQQAANHHLWTPETVARADAAAQLVANGQAAQKVPR